MKSDSLEKKLMLVCLTEELVEGGTLEAQVSGGRILDKPVLRIQKFFGTILFTVYRTNLTMTYFKKRNKTKKYHIQTKNL
jgi:hypothetical protein